MPLTVATTCPSCGGDLEFEQGTNAVHCSWCGSDHVVTGRGRVMSYWIKDRISARDAASRALNALSGSSGELWNAREATLFFVPFHHFTGQSLSWEAQEVPIDGSSDMGDSRRSFGDLFGTGLADSGFTPSRPLTERRFELFSRCIDRSFAAVEAPLGITTLGLKPGVLKLSLFVAKTVKERGIVVPPTVSIDSTAELAFANAAGSVTVSRSVFGRSAATIFYPLWLVEVYRAREAEEETALAVVDGVSGDMYNRAAPPATLDMLVTGNGREYETAGLRPLKCPNCGSSLPVRPDDVLFICSGCRRGWYIRGTEFTEVPFSTARPRTGRPADMEYVPFWSVECRLRTGERVVANKHDLEMLAPGLTLPGEQDKGVPLRFFAPGIRIRDPRLLSRLAQLFTRKQPVWERCEEQPACTYGCYLSPEDALLVAPIVLFALIPKGNKKAVGFALNAVVEPVRAELVMFPFVKGGYDYVDGLFGLSLPRAALGERSR